MVQILTSSVLTVAAASVFCAPGIALQKDPGQASLSKQHKGDDCIPMLLWPYFYRYYHLQQRARTLTTHSLVTSAYGGSR